MAIHDVSGVPSASPVPVTTGRTEQVAIRLPHDHVERAKAIRVALARPGLAPPSLSEVMRAIFARGIEGWEAELGIAAKPPAPSSPRTKAAKKR